MTAIRNKAAARIEREEEGSDTISLGMLEGLIGYHLRRASAVFRTDFARAMEDIGIGQVPLAVLSVIAANPGVNQGAVGQILGIKRANMVGLINELVDRALVTRKTSTSDRRAFELTVTPAGKALLDDSQRRIEAHERRMLHSFSDGERQILLELLERIEFQDI